MKTILLFGAGKSATVLIDFLRTEAGKRGWKFLIADANREQILLKTGESPEVDAIGCDINDAAARSTLVKRADLVISMMPPALHHLIAEDCIHFGKHLLTASYVDSTIRAFDREVRDKNLLFLCEMGLDPGIDHMSAMRLLDHIRKNGQVLVSSFKSHCGGLVAPESDDNPWHYKISWNPRNVVLAGKAGAIFLEDGLEKRVPYEKLFADCEIVSIEGLGDLSAYANRDSLSYIPLYGLDGVSTFIRTTLRYPVFCSAWQAVAAAGLTDDQIKLNTSGMTLRSWAAPILPYVNAGNKELFTFLGFYEDIPVPAKAQTSADVLQYLLENKLAMQEKDKDMIVMQHEIEFDDKLALSTLLVKGTDHLRTAMAKTVGLPLGIAACLILENKIQLRGVQIPTSPEIYTPVLAELEKQGIIFLERITIKEKK